MSNLGSHSADVMDFSDLEVNNMNGQEKNIDSIDTFVRINEEDQGNKNEMEEVFYLRFNFRDKNDFFKVNFESIKDALNKTSGTWAFLSFIKNEEGFYFLEKSKKNFQKFINTKYIKIQGGNEKEKECRYQVVFEESKKAVISIIHDVTLLKESNLSENRVLSSDLNSSQQKMKDGTILKISFENQDLDFSNVSWCLFYGELIKISEFWIHLAFADKLKSVLILVNEKADLEKLLSVERVEIDGTNHNIIINKISDNKTKGIIYSPITKPLSNDCLMEKLAKFGVIDVVKIQKKKW